MRILLIEDDEALIDLLSRSLTSQNYLVDTAEDGLIGLDFAESVSYNLILTDVELPKLDGIRLCQRLRSGGCSTPILLITAREASSDRIRGLDAGADDYLIKPLNLDELHARVRALLRRGEVAPTPLLTVGLLRLNPSSCQVTYAGKPLNLTPKEYLLLELFLRNPERVFSRGYILQHLWTFDDPPLEESVKAHIKGLRQKLKAVGAIDWIENVYGIGYRLKPGVGQERGVESLESGVRNQEVPSPPTIATRETALNQCETSDDLLSPLSSVSLLPHLSSSPTEQRFSQAMGDLWDRYAGLMAQRLTVLQQMVAALQTGTLTEELQQEAGRAAHKLAGVLGMFDREAGSQLARQIEQLVQGESILAAGQDKHLGDLVQTLAEQMQRVPSQAHKASNGMTTDDKIDDRAIQTEKIAAASEAGQDLRSYPVEFASLSLPKRVGNSVNILVVDDDPTFLAALRPLLEPWGICMTTLEDPFQFWQVLPTADPDLLLLDVEMPELTGIELCQAIRTDPTWQGIPILFLTAHCEMATIQQIFAAGADDYLTKPVVGVELLTRISNRLERIRLLQTFSTQDPFTGLPNQPESHRDLEALLQQASRQHKSACLAVLRMAELQTINIQYGHSVGYQVLQRWGQLLRATFQRPEVLGYWGNGEFVVGLPFVPRSEAIDYLANLSLTLRQQVFTAPEDGSRFQVTCQVAIAEFPRDGETVRSLYKAARSGVES
ncbi:MAG: response regulator [Scytolyngbya sp. HA4215-MV1]|nr:response regulator [Scytolyngbya sp. HA4215-MV1]